MRRAALAALLLGAISLHAEGAPQTAIANVSNRTMISLDGLISDQGQHKQAFYVLQKFYKEKARGAAGGPKN